MSKAQPELAFSLLNLLGRDRFEFRALAETSTAKSNAEAEREAGNKFAGMTRRTGTLEGWATLLVRLNEDGCGIFVQINEANGSGFKAGNIVASPCAFADLDHVPTGHLDRLHLRPHLIVESSPGKSHAYYRIADLPIDQFSKVQERLARLFGSDPVVKDKPRIMRLPGFLHQKDPENPHLVQPIEQNDVAPYSLSDFLQALETAEREQGIDPAQDRAAQPAASTLPKSQFSDEIKRSEEVLRFLIGKGQLAMDGYDHWTRVGFALRYDHGEEGWPLWLQLSSEAGNFDGEEACRQKWDALGEPSPDTQPLTMATFVAMAKEHGWKDTAKRKESNRGKSSKATAAYVAIRLAEAAGDTLWCDEQGIEYVSVECKTPDGRDFKQHMRISDSHYSALLARRYFEAVEGDVLSADQTRAAVQILAQTARMTGHKCRVFIRTAEHEGAIYIDLGRGDGTAVRCTAQGWEIVETPPVRFAISSRGALPLPERGGTLADFEPHLNLCPTGRVQFVACAIAALMPSLTYVVLFLVGEQGTSKSTMGDMFVSLTDPPKIEKGARYSFTQEERNLVIQAQRCHVLYFDNMSSISGAHADMLCRIATGGAFAHRRLHTDADEVQFNVLRPTLITSIATPTGRADLLDRSIRITAKKITHRRSERLVMEDFERDRPRLFGFLLDCICDSIRNRAATLAAVEEGNIKLPRQADMAQAVEGCAERLGLALGEFCSTLMDQQADAQIDAIEANPMLTALLRHFAEGRSELEVTAGDLLAKLNPENRNIPGWPRANQVGPIFTRNAAGLEGIGIKVHVLPPSGRKNVKVFRISAEPHLRGSAAPHLRGKDYF